MVTSLGEEMLSSKSHGWRRKSTLVPKREKRSVISCCVPEPTASMVITAATPITMPRLVSAERILLAKMALTEMRKTEIRVSIICALPRRLFSVRRGM